MVSPPQSTVSANANSVTASPHSLSRSFAWASVVRGDFNIRRSSSMADSPITPTPPVSAPIVVNITVAAESHSNSNGNGDQQQPVAWTGAHDGGIETGSVIGGDISWPALSESTRSVLRSPSDPYVRGPGLPSTSLQVPIIPNPPQRQLNSNANNAIRRSRGRGSSGGALNGNGGNGNGRGHYSVFRQSYNIYNQPLPLIPPQFPFYEVPQLSVYTAIPDTQSFRPYAYMNNNYSFPRGNNGPRRDSYGSRPRYNGNNNTQGGARRGQGQERGDVQYIPLNMGCMPPPPPLPHGYLSMAPLPYIYNPSIADQSSYIYNPPIAFESYRPMLPMPPINPNPPSFPNHESLVSIALPETISSSNADEISSIAPSVSSLVSDENSLPSKIIKQVNYYFSDENLSNDVFLKSHMDNNGWVSIDLIATFNCLRILTSDISLIIESLGYSTVVEVKKAELGTRLVSSVATWNQENLEAIMFLFLSNLMLFKVFVRLHIELPDGERNPDQSLMMKHSQRESD
ncbi:la-related protein 1B-like [Andrographis paniculata]|uniref:la-related protein 1B-like n=1 Tax=Andrographis paniculata TaxID=175694 RepID=UPI0021E7DEA4|nr:la-related protein 1B-like [Andrographis paniculata]